MFTRRQFLLATAAASSAAAIGYISSAKKTPHWLVSACSNNNNEHFVAAFTLNGQLINTVKLPARGHDAIALPNKPGHALILARRPGTFMLEVDFINGTITHQITAQSDSHFYGHGVISPQHNVLLTSENNFATGAGSIVVRDSKNYQILDQYSSGGIGPHQLGLMPDGNSIVIANGGIKTHPEQPRKKLNIETMAPNLAYLALASGQISASFKLDNHQLSIRHLAVSKQGKVVAGLQYQGPKNDLVALAFSHQGENAPKYLSASEHLWRRINQYTASVCIDDSQDMVAISCPRADLVTYWSLTNDNYLGSEKFVDCAGLTHCKQIYASSGKGRVITANTHRNNANNALAFGFPGLKWDNHLTHIVA